MKNTVSLLPILFLLLLSAGRIQAQDSAKQNLLNNIFQKIVNSITVDKIDSTIKATVLNNKSELPYAKFEGKVIRRIVLRQLGFEKVFTDTAKTINYYGTRILNSLHTDTREWVIRDNLFVKSGTVLNRYVLADNERYLRSLEFIQDARIIPRSVKGSPDSVDLEIITKDFFSITGSADVGSATRQKLYIAESNLAGAGQKLELYALIDQARSPTFGYEMRYTKNSLFHTFINASIGYSKIKPDRFGEESVNSFYVQLDRPLVSPYSRIAGGFYTGINQSKNKYNRSDSLFFDFNNTVVDAWGGVNIGVNQLLENNQDRSRTFAALRYFQNGFARKPYQIGERFDPVYNELQGMLGEVTFFRQDFVQSNYIYGFGTTEDVPYGYNVAVTAGWSKQLYLERPYFGVNANRYTVTKKGEFFHAFLRAGVFHREGKLEDVSILVGGSIYSKLFLFDNWKFRQYLKVSFSKLSNTITNESLRINNALGLRYFANDSISGRQRMSAYAESFMFLKTKIIGFQLAPFAFVDGSLLTGNTRFFQSDFFTGVGGGIRTRNENLVFGTIELRFAYFPRKVPDLNPFKVSFVSNLRFRYNSNYVKRPDFIQINSDDTNSFY